MRNECAPNAGKINQNVHPAAAALYSHPYQFPAGKVARRMTEAPAFNLLAIFQAGRLQYEALLLAASLAETNPALLSRLHLAEPEPGPLWPADPHVRDKALRGLLAEMGVTFLSFPSRHFGAAYPYGNKIEALAALPPVPFVFFDTDTLFLGPLADVPFDFDRPTASLNREDTWPKPDLYGPGTDEIWRSLYGKFSLDFQSSLDLSEPDGSWRRYLYFNAGWFFHRDPQAFGQRFLSCALAIRDDPPPQLTGQSLDPWLDQVALPLVIHSFGGGRATLPPGLLDGRISCHYRTLPLLYAKESDQAVEMLEKIAATPAYRRILRDHAPVKACVYRNQGRRARALFDRANLPRREQAIRNRLKREGLWIR